MKVTEENDWKIVLADESDVSVLLWFLIIIFSGWVLATGLYATGMIPGTGPYEAAVMLGRSPSFQKLLNLKIVWLAIVAILLGALYQFLRTYPVVVLDKIQGKLVLNRVRKRNRISRVIREVDLKQIRCARIGNEGDALRLEFELKNGELLTPRETYTEHNRPNLFALVEKINKFLKVNLEVIKDAERSVSQT
jgi:hypothetical protein